MNGTKLVLTMLLLGSLISGAFSGARSANDHCTGPEQWTGGCPTAGASANGRTVDINAERPGFGADGVPPTVKNDAPEGTASAPDEDSNSFAPHGGAGQPEDGSVMPPVIRDPISAWCVPRSPCDPTFSVSVSDLVSFAPAAPQISMEPNGWGVVGLPTNFMAHASGGTQSGMLLGYQASVRFAALSYTWIYSDGGSRTTSDAGATWRVLGVPEFSATATSHVFATSGVFPVRLTVTYGAEYRYAGQSWQRVIGTVTASSDALNVIAGEAKTVLVNHDCTADAHGPGC